MVASGNLKSLTKLQLIPYLMEEKYENSQETTDISGLLTISVIEIMQS